MLVSRRRVIGLLSAFTASLSVPSRARAAEARFDDVSEGVLSALALINAFRVAADVPQAELHPALMASAAVFGGIFPALFSPSVNKTKKRGTTTNRVCVCVMRAKAQR